MIARARGNDAARFLVGREVEQPVERATVLERSGALQTLELEVQRSRQQVRQAGRGHGRRQHHGIANPLARGAYVSEVRHLHSARRA
jgi:hypothetical protein